MLQQEIENLRSHQDTIKELHEREMGLLRERLERITKERNDCLTSITEYRQEIARLTDPNNRGEAIDEMTSAMGKVTEYISSSEE
jgi:phage shock protein A